MTKKAFQAESRRLLDLMIHSIYTHREIFLRELISNASDAMDKMYYRALTDDQIPFHKDDYLIDIHIDKENRSLRIVDHGIGMTKEELEENLGTIAKSGSQSFKETNEIRDGYDIIGQFGVGFYSAFMVADKVTVLTKSPDSETAYRWESEGTDGYTIEETHKDAHGTEITLIIKENDEEESYDDYLENDRIRQIIKKYSDFIRYPIRLEEETVNSMVPIWRKNKSELTTEDYNNFYSEKHYGFDEPIKYIHTNVDGSIRYRALLYIPESRPFDYYTRDYEKGLELYSNGVLIMEKSADLLPDHFSFVKGLVDSEDLSLNISREMLQHDRQLKFIAKNIRNKIKNELLNLLNENRERYEAFYDAFGRQLKYGVYTDYGVNKEEIQDLLLFQWSKDKKLVTLKEYVENMPEDQSYIYYAAGESAEKIDKSPQVEAAVEKGYPFLYLTEEVDEFAINMLGTYEEKEFRSLAGNDTGLESEEKELDKDLEEESADMLAAMKEHLNDKVQDVRLSKRLRKHPVCLIFEGELSIEMEKILRSMPEGQNVAAQKILEINPDHTVYKSLKMSYNNDREKFHLYTDILYGQALLIEGLPMEDPVDFADKVSRLM
ncbi:molecular chaperone HtpG [Alkalibacter rhizosphaerae]|uniref:Chaperone protein HtpG n=1 Tax=Alkalibacter rhizosphaerae TaxID=2815577 RepID=A0A974XE40_9FIRM|nr:molecular chaperone HtpG [Alkalibacter rhizosphaerae]QSX08172.1 molecular chaperone HtpG [Alkalibacter rhizosphaerae]